MRAQECVYNLAVMARAIVNEQEHSVPSLLQFAQESYEIALPLSFGEDVDECARCARSEYVDAFVLAVYDCNGFASFARPAARNERKEAECGLILRAHNKSFLSVVPCLASRFFLNRSFSSGEADL